VASGTYRNPEPETQVIEHAPAKMTEIRPRGINILKGKTPVGDPFYALQFLVNPDEVLSVIVNEEGKDVTVRGLTGGIHLP
jgi:hypothetical protein